MISQNAKVAAVFAAVLGGWLATIITLLEMLEVGTWQLALATLIPWSPLMALVWYSLLPD